MTVSSHILAAATVPLSALAGNKLGQVAANLSPDIPTWIAALSGPFGTLVATIVAIRWLLARLNKSEQKEERRDEERLKNFETLVNLTHQGQQVIDQNSAVLSEVKEILKK
jgi:hypothetical protein